MDEGPRPETAGSEAGGRLQPGAPAGRASVQTGGGVARGRGSEGGLHAQAVGGRAGAVKRRGEALEGEEGEEGELRGAEGGPGAGEEGAVPHVSCTNRRPPPCLMC